MTDSSDERRQLLAAARRYLAARDAGKSSESRPLLPQVQRYVDKVARIRAQAAAKRESRGEA